MGNLAVIFPLDRGFRSAEGNPLQGEVNDLWCQISSDNELQPLSWAQFVRASDRKALEAEIDNETKKARLVFGTAAITVAGKYRCEMRAEGQTEIVYGNMFVYSRPVVHINGTHKPEAKKGEEGVVAGAAVSGVEGGNITLVCPVIGYPKPDVAWFKDGEEFLETERIRLDKREPHLHIYFLEETDEGVYRCEAKNSFKKQIDSSIEDFQVVYEQRLRISSSYGWIYPLLVIIIILLVLFIVIYSCAAWTRYKHDQYDVEKREKTLRRGEDGKRLGDDE